MGDTHNGVLFSLRKEGNSDTCHYTCELWRHYMLSEIRQSQKNKYYVTPLTWGTQGSKIQRQEKKKGDCQGLGAGENGELLFHGYRVSD